VDLFAVPLRAGQTLVAALEARDTLRSPMDGVLQVLSPEGFVLDQNDDHRGMDPLLAFRVPKDGTYLVRTFAFPEKPDASVRFSGGDRFIYRLTLTTQPYVDYVLPATLPQDRGGELYLFGWSLPAKTMTVLPATDAVTFVSQRGWGNFVAVPREGSGGSVVMDGANAKPRTVTVPGSAAGRFTKHGVVHSFELAGHQGQKLAFTARGRSLDFAAEPAFKLLDPAGKVLASAAPGKLGADAKATVKLPQDGTYRVQVRDLHDLASVRSAYQLDITADEPEFRLGVPTDQYRLVPGKPLEIPVTIERRGGFKDDVTLQVEGAADLGLKVSTAKKDAKTITLKMHADKSGPSRLIRIVGTAKGVQTPRPALTTIADLAYRTDRLWLTVARGK
jgi:hypothetical protein